MRVRGEGGKGYVRHIDLLMFVLVEIPLDKLLEIPQSHLPCLALFRLHVIESALSESGFDMLFEPVVEKGATAQPAGSNG